MRAIPIIALVLTSTLPISVEAQESMRVAYRGEVIDDAGAPISGVFPLMFKLYTTEDGTTSFWQEPHFVSVYEGGYDVILGDAQALPAAREGQRVFLAVEVGDIGEFTRHEIELIAVSTPQSREEVIAELDLTFADISERAIFAVEAEQADDCIRLGGKTLEELDHYEDMLEEIVELRDQLDEVSGAQLGSRTTTLERIGGSGGNSYSRMCPAGHVVTGVRGGAGALIDSVELICSPLR